MFTGKSIIGEVQVLSKNSPLVTGLDYAWKPFKQVVPTVSGQRWAPMQVQYIVPCVIVLDDGGTEILGMSGSLFYEKYSSLSLSNIITLNVEYGLFVV